MQSCTGNTVVLISDLPCVLSSDKVAMIDPHEKYFMHGDSNTSGYSWSFDKQLDEMKKLSHQFDPFRGLFGITDKTFKSGSYNGTVFR